MVYLIAFCLFVILTVLAIFGIYEYYERKYIVNGNTVFDFVISLESLKAAEKYNLFDCKDWYDKVDLLIPKIAKEFYLNKEDINFKCNYEINEKKIDTDNIQPHIHLTFWFNKNFKHISTINKKTFKNIKKHIHNIFIENEFDTINILEKNLYINEINQSLNKYVLNQIGVLY